VGIGLPLLALGALGLSRFPPATTLAAAAAFSFTSLMVLRMVLAENPYWFVPSERLEIAKALRPRCRPGDLVLSPPDIGLYASGLTACGGYVAHPAAAGFEERTAEVRDFYARNDPAARAAFLDERCITHVVLPAGAGDVPVAWLGDKTPFRFVAGAGHGASAIDAFARLGGVACLPPP
jgi:hypothetical protein